MQRWCTTTTTTSIKCSNVSISYQLEWRTQCAFRFYYCVINTYFAAQIACTIVAMIYTRNKPLVTRFVLSSVRSSIHSFVLFISCEYCCCCCCCHSPSKPSKWCQRNEKKKKRKTRHHQMKQLLVHNRRNWRRRNGSDDDETQYINFPFTFKLPFRNKCMYRHGKNGKATSAMTTFRKTKISSNRPVMESNWQKENSSNTRSLDELVCVFMKCWSLGYLKISTIHASPHRFLVGRAVVLNCISVYLHDRVRTMCCIYGLDATDHFHRFDSYIVDEQLNSERACREYNVPLYVYTIHAKHFRLQILFTD